MASLYQVRLLETDEGDVPFEEWYYSLKDKITKIRIRRRLDRLELGHLGDAESIGDGIYELRLHFGAGYRIYFTKVKKVIIVLLGGGDKSTQQKDINKVKQLWREYKDEAERYARKLGW
jgi:putative addiction module killer protein